MPRHLVIITALCAACTSVKSQGIKRRSTEKALDLFERDWTLMPGDKPSHMALVAAGLGRLSQEREQALLIIVDREDMMLPAARPVLRHIALELVKQGVDTTWIWLDDAVDIPDLDRHTSVFISSFVGDRWRDAKAWKTLTTLSHESFLVLVSMFPTHLWPRSAFDAIYQGSGTARSLEHASILPEDVDDFVFEARLLDATFSVDRIFMTRSLWRQESWQAVWKGSQGVLSAISLNELSEPWPNLPPQHTDAQRVQLFYLTASPHAKSLGWALASSAGNALRVIPTLLALCAAHLPESASELRRHLTSATTVHLLEVLGSSIASYGYDQPRGDLHLSFEPEISKALLSSQSSHYQSAMDKAIRQLRGQQAQLGGAE